MYNIHGLQMPPKVAINRHGPVVMWCLLFVTLLMIVGARSMAVVLCQLFEYYCVVLSVESVGLGIHVKYQIA